MTNMEKITKLREYANEIERIRKQSIIDRMKANIAYSTECLAIEISRQISEQVLNPYIATPTVEVDFKLNDVGSKLDALAREIMGESSLKEVNYVIANIERTGLYLASINSGESGYFLVYESELLAALEGREIEPTTQRGMGANKAYKFEIDLKDHILRKRPEKEVK